MTLEDSNVICLAAGFKQEDEPISYVRSLSKGLVHVSLTGYEGRFVEGCFEVYAAPKTRAAKNVSKAEAEKRGYVPVSASLFRSVKELRALLATTS